MDIIDIISFPLALAGGLLLYGPVLLYLWLQGVALWRWRGWWLIPALPPLVVMGPDGGADSRGLSRRVRTFGR